MFESHLLGTRVSLIYIAESDATRVVVICVLGAKLYLHYFLSSFSFVTGVSINLSPFANMMTWWSVNVFFLPFCNQSLMHCIFSMLFAFFILG